MKKASTVLVALTALAWGGALAAAQAANCPHIFLHYGKPSVNPKTVSLSLEVSVPKTHASGLNATNLPVLAVKLPVGFRRLKQSAFPDSAKEVKYPLTFDTERTFEDRRWTVYARNVLTPTVLKRKIKLQMAVTCSLGPIVTFDVSTYLNNTRTCLEKTPIKANLGKVLATCPPTPAPTKTPTTHPTQQPTTQPTQQPTATPTVAPTKQPTSTPTQAPTKQPTSTPTQAPTKQPTEMPTKMPSASPTVNTASIAYKDCGTSGIFIKIPTPSTMDSTALQAANLYQYISSLIVPSCVKITLYSGNNFDGTSPTPLTFTGPTTISCLADAPYNFNDQTRSLESEFVC